MKKGYRDTMDVNVKVTFKKYSLDLYFLRNSIKFTTK